MPTDFKHELGPERIQVMAKHLARQSQQFNASMFIDEACLGIEALALMQRNQRIVHALKMYLPQSFELAVETIISTLAPYDNQQDEHGIHGWLSIPLCEYIGQRATEEPDLALAALSQITALFSAEWGIRHLLSDTMHKAMPTLLSWCTHKNEHIRRLASEGTRPRLPWGIQLKAVISDPSLTFPILERLKDDDSEYVRRSVANHLNDMTKDHADWVVEKITPWWNEKNRSNDRTRLIKHALRTLIKQGHPQALSLLGYKPIKPAKSVLTLENHEVSYGESLAFFLDLELAESTSVVLDYAIHFKKKNGTLSPKVFKWKNIKIDGATQRLTKKHLIKPITTRRYYNGEHKLVILLNGHCIAQSEFTLLGVTD